MITDAGSNQVKVLLRRIDRQTCEINLYDQILEIMYFLSEGQIYKQN